MKISVVGLRGFPNVQGGIETHCKNLYFRLVKMGLDITVYGRKKYRVSDPSDVKMVWLPCIANQHFETISYMFFAFFHILFNKPDIVHIHGIGPAFFAPLFRLIGCKVVLTHHGADYKRCKWGFFAKKILRVGERIGIKFSNNIIVLNKSNPISENKKSAIIPNGVELSSQKNNGQGKFIFAMGRFVKEKGFSDLLDAICLNPDGPDSRIHRIIIAGKADHCSKYSRDFVEKAKRLGVELPGFVHGEAKEKLLLECGLFVIPSHHEGLPFTLLEAMSYGCRILASDIPEHREVGLPEECYFPCGDVKALANCLNPDSPDSRIFPIADYDSLLREKYDWDKIAMRTAEVYKSL
ncbi:MAG: glycosyltransferase family 4 protein [Fibromonadales bacterium]|nr:glycosyltransferase family 4 protein [Fibromonadales bacterium]